MTNMILSRIIGILNLFFFHFDRQIKKKSLKWSTIKNPEIQPMKPETGVGDLNPGELAALVMRFVKIDGIIVISIVDLVKNDIQHVHIKKKCILLYPIVEPQVMRCVK
jgi:hypothetical protein